MGQYWRDKLTQFTNFERFVILLGIAAVAGIAWELAEFSTSQRPLSSFELLHRCIYSGSLRDTLGDLTADIFGGAIYGLFTRK